MKFYSDSKATVELFKVDFSLIWNEFFHSESLSEYFYPKLKSEFDVTLSSLNVNFTR